MRRWGTAVAAAAVLIAGCGGSSHAAAAKPATAALKIRDEAAQRQHGGAAFVTALDGDALAVGDTVRTNGSGFVEIDYRDGSLTRIDSNASFTVHTLTAPTAQRVVGSLDGGRAWNKVQRITSSEGRYEVDTPVATAAVRGTEFDVDCRATDGSCTFTVAEGTVVVTPTNGAVVVLSAGDSVTVPRSGTPQRQPHRTTAQLRDDPWFAHNLDLDAPRPPARDLSGTYDVTRTVIDANGNNNFQAGQVDHYTTTLTCTGSVCTNDAWGPLDVSGDVADARRVEIQSCPPGGGTGEVSTLGEIAFRITPNGLEGVERLSSTTGPSCTAESHPILQSIVAVRRGSTTTPGSTPPFTAAVGGA